MGICYSSRSGKTDTEQEGSWWKSNNDSKINAWKKTSLDAKFKKSSSGDFASFIGKFGGGGAGSAADDRALHQISGRLFSSGSSSIASLFTQQGKKGTNQDAMIVWENFNSRSDTIFCGVFDGHGPYGHMVARRVRDSLPVLLCTQWIANSNSVQNCLNENGIVSGSTMFEECMDDDWCQSSEVEENEKLPEMYLPLKQSILKAFKLMDKELKLLPAIDCFCSGTTAVTLVKQGQDLIIGNVGEAARIQKCKGRVFALQDEPEVARVWLPNSDSPGLAMARAFGDFCLKDFGLISVPDVYYHRLTERDEFVVLASDWAARALVDCATRAWRLKYPTSKMDDCAVVCLFLEHVSAPDVVQAENDLTKASEEAVQRISTTDGDSESLDVGDVSVSHASLLDHSVTIRNSGEIVPVPESTKEKLPERCLSQSKRSLAECLSTAEDEEWSALEGDTRVNSLLSLPRYGSPHPLCKWPMALGTACSSSYLLVSSQVLGMLGLFGSSSHEEEEDPPPPPDVQYLHHHHHQQIQPLPSQGFTSPAIHMRQLLISCAKLISQSDISAAHRLINILSVNSSPYGDSTERLVHQFTKALYLRLNGFATATSGVAALMIPNPNASSTSVVSTISASSSVNVANLDSDEALLQSSYLSLNQITPFIRFIQLTANQAILEAIEGKQAIHILDFDIMHGVQWPPLMQAIAERYPPPTLRITGTGQELDILRRTGDRLVKFAHSLGLRFQFHPLLLPNNEDPISVAPAVLHLPDETLAVNCVLYLHRLLKDRDHLRLFLHRIKAMNPKVVTVAEREANHNHPLFLQRFAEALDHYTAVFDSLEATVPPNSRDRLTVEQVWFGREIADIVAADGKQQERTAREVPVVGGDVEEIRFQQCSAEPFRPFTGQAPLEAPLSF
ncbi:hypothetical protein F0562_009897 [Nyssa sinensis]|uniref:PPM-type phosphatase domain-containing protein n=1 Tax=Nyssa sinensis TaxID=561372 RepID=A0A5J4ZZZ2_9ASTE|nr:hypothetical protein F0562_009897 [Nyssa sinensis]